MKAGSVARAVVGIQNIFADCWMTVGICGCLPPCPHTAVLVEYSAAGFYTGLGLKELAQGVAEAVWDTQQPFTLVESLALQILAFAS